MPKRIMVQCATQVNRDAVKRTTIGGIEHIIVSSATLPDDVVMNGGLYPAEEVAKSFHTLERTLAPVEHPVDSNGNFLSASDPDAIHGFHAGAFNTNVRRENGRVHIDKTINVPEALKSEKGKRLLDRVNEIETNDNPRPMHTSVALFLEVEVLEEPQTNAAGDEFTWIGRNFSFDHDAILLDSVGAATPGQGVGMAVNADGDEIEVQRVSLTNDAPARKARDKRTNQTEGTGFTQIQEQLQQAIKGVVTADFIWLVDVFDDLAIFETPQGFFQVPWSMSEGNVELAGIPIRVDKRVTYIPKVNSNNGGQDKMKELMLNALKEAGVETKDLTDDQLFAKYNELLTTNATEAEKAAAKAAADEANKGDDSDIGKAVANAIKPLTDKLDALATKINATDEAELTKLAELVGNSDKHPGIDVEAAKAIPLDTLKAMAANCAETHGIGFSAHNNDGDDGFSAPADMPK